VRSPAHGTRLLRRAGARCDEGKRERGATRFTLRASATGEEVELSWQWWTMVATNLTSTTKRRGNREVEPELGWMRGEDGALWHLL
jgi:hypothetical protein